MRILAALLEGDRYLSHRDAADGAGARRAKRGLLSHRAVSIQAIVSVSSADDRQSSFDIPNALQWPKIQPMQH
jgi:hypothetical protein